MCKKWFEAYDQTIIYSFYITNENKNSEDDSDDSGDLQEPHDSDDDVTVDGDFSSKNNQNNHVCSNDSDYFLGIRDPPDVEPYDVSEANKYWNFPTTNAADNFFEVRAETAYGGRNNEFTISGSGILCENTHFLVRKRH